MLRKRNILHMKKEQQTMKNTQADFLKTKTGNLSTKDIKFIAQ